RARNVTGVQTWLQPIADDTSREYGAANGSLSATISGFKNLETLATSGVTGSPSCTTTRTASSPVNGTTGYPITCTLGSLAANNYDFHFTAGKLTVTKATLEVTADDTSREDREGTGSLSA